MSFEIYQVGNTIVLFLGVMGNEGLMIHKGADLWEYHPPVSLVWDSFHQQVYRNFKAEALSVEEMERSGVRMPDLAACDVPAHGRSWADNFNAEAPFSAVPRGVLPELRRHAGEEMEVFLVLMEDRYETSFGDGRFLYPTAAFWTRNAAECHMRQLVQNETDPAKREWYQYSLKQVRLLPDDSTGAVKAMLDINPYEHYTIEDVLRLLAARAAG